MHIVLSTCFDLLIYIPFTHTGMAGQDEIANAVLGGASDYMCDIFANIMRWYYAKDDQKVTI